MPVSMGSTHIKVEFNPSVEYMLRDLADRAWMYIQRREISTEDYTDLVLPYKVRHYLDYCAQNNARRLAIHRGDQRTYVYRLPKGTWSKFRGGFSFVTYAGSPRAVGILSEPYDWRSEDTGTLTISMTRPDVWIISVKEENVSE